MLLIVSIIGFLLSAAILVIGVFRTSPERLLSHRFIRFWLLMVTCSTLGYCVACLAAQFQKPVTMAAKVSKPVKGQLLAVAANGKTYTVDQDSVENEIAQATKSHQAGTTSATISVASDRTVKFWNPAIDSTITITHYEKVH